MTGLLFIICVSRQKYLVKTTGRKILQKLNDSSALTLGLVDPDIFFVVGQVEVDLQMCMFWSHLLSERRRLSFRNILTTWLTISTNRNNLKRKYLSKESYDIQTRSINLSSPKSPKQHGVANDSVWRERYVIVAMTIINVIIIELGHLNKVLIGYI